MKTTNQECTNDQFNSLVETWIKAFNVTLPSANQKMTRLKELQTWDKPRHDNELEHAAKRHALIRILSRI